MCVRSYDRGVWVAYHHDWSGFIVFDTEIEALRYAVSNSMAVGFATWGQELGGGRFPSRTVSEEMAVGA